jgi:hypothetical protein
MLVKAGAGLLGLGLGLGLDTAPSGSTLSWKKKMGNVSAARLLPVQVVTNVVDLPVGHTLVTLFKRENSQLMTDRGFFACTFLLELFFNPLHGLQFTQALGFLTLGFTRQLVGDLASLDLSDRALERKAMVIATLGDFANVGLETNRP